MQTKNTISSKYSVENGGRSLVLLLLFFVALLSFKSSGFTSFAAVCCAPLVILFGYFFFRIKMSLFYTLFIVNTLLMFAQRHYSIPVPISMINEMMEIMLIAMALIEVANYKITNLLNVMGATLLVWLAFCTLELLNDSCDIGIDVYRWYTGARLMSMQLVYAFIVYTLFVNTPEKLMRVFVLWACFILFASFWVWKQINIGMTDAEKSFLYSSPSHIVAGKIRYFSCRRRVIMELAAMTFVICNVAVFRAGRLDFFHELRLVSMTERRFQHVSAHGTYLSGFLCRFRTGNVSRFVFSRVTYGAFVPVIVFVV